MGLIVSKAIWKGKQIIKKKNVLKSVIRSGRPRQVVETLCAKPNGTILCTEILTQYGHGGFCNPIDKAIHREYNKYQKNWWYLLGCVRK